MTIDKKHIISIGDKDCISSKILIIPTKNISPIIIHNNCLEFNKNNCENFTKKYIKANIKFYHLYLTSDDKIESGDWFVHSNTIYKCEHINDKGMLIEDKKHHSLSPLYCKKIISATDNLLLLDMSNFGEEYKSIIIPKPKEEFILKYMEIYNRRFYKSLNLKFYAFIQCIHNDNVDDNTTNLLINTDNTINIFITKLWM